MKIYDLCIEFREKYMLKRLRPTTISGYDVNIDNHILPCLAPVELVELTADDIDYLTERLQKKGLSNKTVLYVHATFRKMLNYAKKREYIDRNVYDQVDLPRADSFSYNVLNKSELRRLIDAVVGTRMELPVVLAACYGLRRGEVLGLRRGDYEPIEGVLHIRRTMTNVSGTIYTTPCKTVNGDRYILIAETHRHLFEGDTDSIVPLSQYQINSSFQKLAARLGFEGLRFHDLRHSYATLMMNEGVNPKIVCSVLGHSDVSVTLEIYSHPDISMQKQCLEATKKAGL